MDNVKAHGEWISREIHFSQFSLDWTVDGIIEKVSRILEFADSGYVGMSESVLWRWTSCEGHGDMQPHCNRFSSMYALAIDHGEAMRYLEEFVIETLQSEFGDKIVNSKRYRPGPIKFGRVYFLYLCV